VAWLLYFIHHISQAISVNMIVDRIAGETEAIINETMPRPLRLNRLPDPPSPPYDPRQATLLSEMSGYVRYIDTARLVALAKLYGLNVIVLRRVGHFVPEGVPLANVSNGEKLTTARITELCEVFDIGPTRTLEQDIEFGVLQIVDIALKAISPAVNDPSTAINCIDQLGRVLIRFASREQTDTRYYDPPGVLRVSIPWLTLDRLMESAFEQIRHYSETDVAVSLRLLRALTDISSTIPASEDRMKIAQRGSRIVSGCAAHLPEEEIKDLRSRQERLDRFAEPVSQADATGFQPKQIVIDR
jgi:uncharacterized membrane protein